MFQMFQQSRKKNGAVGFLRVNDELIDFAPAFVRVASSLVPVSCLSMGLLNSLRVQYSV